MPLPQPGEKESKKDYIQRCMANKVTNDDYPNNSQRYAVCNSVYDRAIKKRTEAEENTTITEVALSEEEVKSLLNELKENHYSKSNDK